MTSPHYSARAESYETAIERPADWRDEGACLDVPRANFNPWFPERGATSTDPKARHAAYRYARGLCNGTANWDACPVKAECLADALAHGDFGGMRGGLDPDELRALAKVPEPYYGPVCRERVGTSAGYHRHKRAHEAACDRCGAAEAKARRDQRARGMAQVAS